MKMEKESKALLPTLSETEIAEYEAKAVELATKHNCAKVYVYIGIKPETYERIVSYIKEPNYITKLALMDKASQNGVNMAAEELRMICQIREESHPLTYGEEYECDPYKLGVVQVCINTIGMVIDAYKKK
jgi:hypothetical protein